MKVLAGVFNPIAYDGRVLRAAEALAEDGDVTVVCPAGPELDGPSRLTIVQVPRPGRGFLRQYAGFFRAVVATARRLRPDVIHAHDYFMALPGLVASRLTGARLIYDAHELIIPEKGVSRKPIIRAFSLMERLALPRADLVVAANRERATRMAEHYGLSARPLVIENIPPTPPNGDGPRASNDALERRSPDDFLLVYQGHLKLQRGLSRVIAALPALPPVYRLMIVGDGPDQQALLAEIDDRGLSDRVRYLGRVPRATLSSILAQCDAGVLTYSYDTLNDRYCAPNKVFEYAQAGLPVLATDQAPLRRIFEAYRIGELVREEDGPREIAEVVRRLAARPRAEYQPAIRRFLQDHRWETEAARLRSAVRDIAGARRGA